MQTVEDYLSCPCKNCLVLGACKGRLDLHASNPFWKLCRECENISKFLINNPTPGARYGNKLTERYNILKEVFNLKFVKFK